VPTYDVTDPFLRDWRKLNPADRAAFIAMRKQFVAALRRGGAFPKGLRVEGFKSVPGWLEISGRIGGGHETDSAAGQGWERGLPAVVG
jgi:hypothetical protein